ncbi:hypothetical protein GCM10023334_105070 [Nonomuraea thailandensis]
MALEGEELEFAVREWLAGRFLGSIVTAERCSHGVLLERGGDDHVARTRPVAIVMCGVRLFTAD